MYLRMRGLDHVMKKPRHNSHVGTQDTRELERQESKTPNKSVRPIWFGTKKPRGVWKELKDNMTVGASRFVFGERNRDIIRYSGRSMAVIGGCHNKRPASCASYLSARGNNSFFMSCGFFFFYIFFNVLPSMSTSFLKQFLQLPVLSTNLLGWLAKKLLKIPVVVVAKVQTVFLVYIPSYKLHRCTRFIDISMCTAILTIHLWWFTSLLALYDNVDSINHYFLFLCYG